MTKTISIINHKGGVGKTTSSAIIAELLAFLGEKVLCVDLDQQSNLSMLMQSYITDNENVLSGRIEPQEYNITELFKHRYKTKEEVESIIKKTGTKGIDIIPSSLRHKNTQVEIEKNKIGNNNIILKRALDTIKDKYNYIIIDNAPASDIMTVNSMFASDYVLTPVRMERFSYEGLKETLDSIAFIKEEHGLNNLQFLGAFITQAEVNTKVYKELKESYKQQLGDKFLDTPIRKDIKVAEIETFYKPILEYNANTNIVFDYGNLILGTKILDKKSENNLRKAIGA